MTAAEKRYVASPSGRDIPDGILEPADRYHIQDLLADYNFAFDGGDVEGWASCFTPDGTFEGKYATLNGRQDLVQYALKAKDRSTYRHFTGNFRFYGDSAEGLALVKTYMMYYEIDDSGISFKTTARQEDEVVRHEGAWKIAYRRITADAAKDSSS